MRWFAAAVGILGIAMLSGCVGGEPLHPLAVLAQGSNVEVRYLDCQPATFKSVRLIRTKPDQVVIDGSEPVVWQVDFATPVPLRSITIGGQPPTGGVVSVALAEPLDETAEYDVTFQYNNGASWHVVFQLSRLKDGHVMSEGKYVTREEFDRAKKCP